MPCGRDRKRVVFKLCLLPLAGWALLALGGYIPTGRLAGAAGVRAMLLGQGLVALIVLATLLSAMRRMVGRSPVDGCKIAWMAGIVRFFVTVPLLAGAAWTGRIPVVAFLIWAAITYVVMVMLEAIALTLWTNYLESEKRC